MGDYRHRAVLVTGYHDGTESTTLFKAHKKAKSEKMFGWMTSDIIAGYANGFSTFMVVPSGLKTTTQDGERELHEVFVGWLSKQLDGDQCDLDWAWVQYGDEVDHNCRILDASDRVNEKLLKEEELLGD
jgi:hypothetical protein